jgi:hypothetical protein
MDEMENVDVNASVRDFFINLPAGLRDELEGIVLANAMVLVPSITELLEPAEESPNDGQVVFETLEDICRLGQINLLTISELRVITNLLESHQNDVAIQFAGIQILNRIACTHRELLVEAGCIPRVIAAMRLYLVHADLQEYACSIFEDLTESNAARAEIAALGGIPLIVSAMRYHLLGPVDLQEYACNTIVNLAKDHADNIMAAGGVKAIVFVLRAWAYSEDHEPIQEIGCSALEALAESNERNRMLIGDGGGVEVLLDAMVRRHAGPSLHHTCMSALAALALEDANKTRIVDSRGIEYVVDTMESTMSQVGVQEAGCRVLGHLARDSRGNVKLIGKQGGLHALVEAASEHPTEAIVQEAFRTAILFFTRASVEHWLE